jgi:hypothetical protein
LWVIQIHLEISPEGFYQNLRTSPPTLSMRPLKRGMEILDEVHKSKSIDSIGTLLGIQNKCTACRALERSNKHGEIVFIDYSLFLIGKIV